MSSVTIKEFCSLLLVSQLAFAVVQLRGHIKEGRFTLSTVSEASAVVGRLCRVRYVEQQRLIAEEWS